MYGLKNAAARKAAAKIIQTRGLEAGIGVGYGHSFRSTAELRLATIALGYADGWPRRAAAVAWHRGRKLPFAGRVSMDTIILDISALSPEELAPGDLVELAVREVVHGRPVKNKEALANPEALELFANLAALKE